MRVNEFGREVHPAEDAYIQSLGETAFTPPTLTPVKPSLLGRVLRLFSRQRRDEARTFAEACEAVNAYHRWDQFRR